MRLNRFIGSFSLNKDRIEIDDKDLAHQICAVLKLRTGDKIMLANGDGKEAVAEIVTLDKNFVVVKVLEVSQNKSEENIRPVILYCAILKRENFELVVQKATEVGVKKIVPLITARTIKLGLREDRLLKIIKEAAEQSGRATLPELGAVIELGAAFKNVEPSKSWFCDLGNEKSLPIRSDNEPVSIFVGPEGGWDDKERELAKKLGINFIHLGPLTLRAETAAIIASYLAISGK